ncbi:hypothetical protein TNCT_52451 [Trichonephila clavata]|uniref:Uncharacterized protein n=1 Tax=Trichonephila clavata TaxID=2740835 RepID=A0A8X6H247_TRICU|nr:hypothetical protein TNCT_52451 [Trichonephila clavata]
MLTPYMTGDYPEVAELFTKLLYYQEQRKHSECEYGTLTPCTTAGCMIHGTPPLTPSITDDKNKNNDFPELIKTIPIKRKENDGGFVSPPSRKLIKKPNLIPSSNFNLETENKLKNLTAQEVAASTSTQHNIQPINTTPTATNPKSTPPTPVMLK